MRLAGFEVGPQTPLFLLAGPGVIESEEWALRSVDALAKARPFLETEFHHVH